MAFLQLFQAFDFRSSAFWSYATITADKTGFTIVDGSHRQTFLGDFSVSGDSVTGTVTASSYFYDGVEIYRATGLSADAAALIDLIENHTAAEAYAFVLAGADNAMGSAGADGLVGYNGDDILRGAEGSDRLLGMAGNDMLDGGSGLDTAEYLYNRAAYTVTPTGIGMRVSSTNSEGSDTLAGIERLRFADSALALDVGSDGIGGKAYRLYQAAFDRAPDAAGAGFWLHAMDQGWSLLEVAQQFIQSSEYRAVVGSGLSHRELVTRYYTNTHDRAPDQAGLDFWVKALDRGTSAAEVLVAISESPEHVDARAAIIAGGFEYTPYG